MVHAAGGSHADPRGTVVVCGSEDQVTCHSSGSAEVRDVNGSTVLPGLVDVHNHHMMAGETDLFHLSFPPTASFAEVLEAVREYASGLGADDWVVGETWGNPTSMNSRERTPTPS